MPTNPQHSGAGGPALQGVIRVLNDLASVENGTRSSLPDEVRDFCRSIADWADAFERGMQTVVDSFEQTAEDEAIREARDVVLRLAPRIAKLASEAESINPVKRVEDPRLRAVMPTELGSATSKEDHQPVPAKRPVPGASASVSDIRAEMAAWRRQRAEERRARAEAAARDRAAFVASLRSARRAQETDGAPEPTDASASEGVPSKAEQASPRGGAETPEPAIHSSDHGSSDDGSPVSVADEGPTLFDLPAETEENAGERSPAESNACERGAAGDGEPRDTDAHERDAVGMTTSVSAHASEQKAPASDARFRRTDTDAQSPARSNAEEASDRKPATARFRFRRTDTGASDAAVSPRSFRVAR
ncbi:MAG: hypothetical protein Tsb0013_14750 [Phycisphaerales bacterium]